MIESAGIREARKPPSSYEAAIKLSCAPRSVICTRRWIISFRTSRKLVEIQKIQMELINEPRDRS